MVEVTTIKVFFPEEEVVSRSSGGRGCKFYSFSLHSIVKRSQAYRKLSQAMRIASINLSDSFIIISISNHYVASLLKLINFHRWWYVQEILLLHLPFLKEKRFLMKILYGNF